MRTPGKRIKEEREALGWSQQDLANEISRLKKQKISRAAVAQWEGGSSKSQKPENLFAAAKAMGLSPQWVLDESGEKYQGGPPSKLVDRKTAQSDKELDVQPDLDNEATTKLTDNDSYPAEAARLVCSLAEPDQIEVLHWLRLEAARRQHAAVLAAHKKK